MNICKYCGKKIIRLDYYERHLAGHSDTANMEQPKVEESKIEVQPIPAETPVPEVKDDLITIPFTKNVEIYINGVAYLGKEIKVKNVELASEIVRIAREAYGRSILM